MLSTQCNKSVANFSQMILKNTHFHNYVHNHKTDSTISQISHTITKNAEFLCHILQNGQWILAMDIAVAIGPTNMLLLISEVINSSTLFFPPKYFRKNMKLFLQQFAHLLNQEDFIILPKFRGSSWLTFDGTLFPIFIFFFKKVSFLQF